MKSALHRSKPVAPCADRNAEPAVSHSELDPWIYDAVMWPAEKLLVRRWRRRLYAAASAAARAGVPGAEPIPGGPRVLEIGAGTGAGFAFYAPGTQVAAIEPSIVMAARARIRAVSLRGASRNGHGPSHNWRGSSHNWRGSSRNGHGAGAAAAPGASAAPGVVAAGVAAGPDAARTVPGPDPSAIVVTVVGSYAEKLPFSDGSFDSAIATLTWCSLADPVAAFAEVRRVLRPGGRLFMLEHVHNSWQPARRLQSLMAPTWRRLAWGCRLDQDTIGLLKAAGFTVERRRDHLLGWIVELEASAGPLGGRLH